MTTLGGASIAKKLYVGDSVGIGKKIFDITESLHIRDTSSTILLQNDNNSHSYIDFKEIGTSTSYGIIHSDNLFGLTFTNSTSGTPMISNKALVLNSSGYIGINTSSNINTPLTISTNNFVSVDSNIGYLGLVGGNDSSSGSKVLLYGNNSSENGSVKLVSGSAGSIKMSTTDTERLRIDSTGTVSVLSTTLSSSSSSGSLVSYGGISINSTENCLNVSIRVASSHNWRRSSWHGFDDTLH